MMTRCRSAMLVARCFALFAICTLPFVVATAQSTSATLSGMVADPNKSVVPGAHVTATNNATGLKREATTSSSGTFIIPLLPPSTYTVLVESPGFNPAEIKEVVLNVGDNVALNIQLKVGQVGASVDVKAEAPLINESPAVGTVVDRQFVENIPMNGRSFQSLIILTPGVVAAKANFGEQGQFSINGQRTNSNYYTVDGVSANFSINAGGGTGQAGAGELPALNASGGFSNLVSVDALQEFNIQTSTYAPEYGRSPGGQISLLTRSGTNKFHGAVFDYLRNDVLDATDWFVNARRQRKPALRQNDFGGVFGGPVRIPRLYNGRDKTFFFFSYEGLRLRQPLSASTQVPSLSLRQSAPPAVRTLLDSFPLPTGADLAGGLALATASYSDPTTTDATSIRVDHQMNKLTFFARYNYAPSKNTARVGSSQLNNPRDAFFRTHTLTAGATWTINATMSNEFRANYSHQDAGTRFYLDNFGGAVPITTALLPSVVPQDDTFFSVSIINLATTRIILGRNGEGVQRQLNFIDNFSMAAGNHQIKFGVDYRRLNPSALSRSADLSYTFTTPANIAASIINISTVTRKSPVDYAYRNFSAYAQDAWKSTSQLTLTYGLRWDVNPAPHGRNDTSIYAATQTDNPATLAFASPGTPLWETSYGNIAPRVGASYRLTKGGGTLLRGGFGVFYDLPAGAISNVVILSPNVLSGPAVNNVTYPPSNANIILPALTLTGPFSNVMVTDRHLKSPYTLQWNIAAEHMFNASQVFTLSYIGAAGRRLIRQERYFNASPTFPLLQINRSNAQSDYNALQAQYQRRLSRGFQALASYTWSHSIDTASNDSTALPGTENTNFAQERGPSDFDVRHSFSGALTYDIPKFGSSVTRAILGNWSADLIFTARSATPVNVVFTRDLGFGTFSFRPDVDSGVPLYLNDTNVGGGRRFNNSGVSARRVGPFIVPTALRQGTLGRNALRGFSSNQLNFGIRRRFKFTEQFGAQIRAELFNVFNHPNFADPNGSLGSVNATTGNLTFSSATFGISPSMLNTSLGTGGQTGGFNPLYGVGGPRSVQLSLKLEF
jgi:Carboxypeptidase regulatory-like domain/TonB dependent receptor-like, beta-barrel/TonB-dependent Receptor Plug Domain